MPNLIDGVWWMTGDGVCWKTHSKTGLPWCSKSGLKRTESDRVIGSRRMNSSAKIIESSRSTQSAVHGTAIVSSPKYHKGIPNWTKCRKAIRNRQYNACLHIFV